jgi:hypothetical protein
MRFERLIGPRHRHGRQHASHAVRLWSACGDVGIPQRAGLSTETF